MLLEVEDACITTSMDILTSYPITYRNLHLPALIIAGCFAFIALVLSLYLILQHLRSYTNPSEQKWIVAVLFMVPVYACESILSLWNPTLSLTCHIFRNCYEAFALYSFGSYLVACLGGEHRVIELLEAESEKLLLKPLLGGEDEKPELQQRKFRNFFFQPCVLGKDLLTIEKFGLVQYMILKTVCAFLALALEFFGVYGDGEFKWYYGYPYIAAVLNFSQMWALYCLIQFYNVTHERLKSIKPLAKFISFKAIVFATWWQGLGIALLCSFGILPREGKLQTGLQDFLICIEMRDCWPLEFHLVVMCAVWGQLFSIMHHMAIAAVAHIFVFSASPYYFLPSCEHGQVTMQTARSKLKTLAGDEENTKPSVIEKRETMVEAPGTSVKESVEDIVVEGGQRVVKDVVLTINQAIEPVEKGMTKIHETFHQISVPSNTADEGSELKAEERDKHVVKGASDA